MSGLLTREIWIIAAMAVGTMVTRFLPFFLFPKGKNTPEFIDFLSRTLPFATMGLLVVYCLKGVSPGAAPYGLPELIAILVILMLHHIKGNALLSIGAGTICYMILVQMVF